MARRTKEPSRASGKRTKTAEPRTARGYRMEEPWEYGQGHGFGGEDLGTRGRRKGAAEGRASETGKAEDQQIGELYRRAGLYSSGDFNADRTPNDTRRTSRIDRAHGAKPSEADDPGYGYRRYDEGFYGGAQEARPKELDFGDEARPGRGAATNDWTASRDDEQFEDEYQHWRNAALDIHDRHYFAWRAERARRYDEDYERWRQHRRQRFAREFDDWRDRQASDQQGRERAPRQVKNATVRRSGDIPMSASQRGGGAAPGTQRRKSGQKAKRK